MIVPNYLMCWKKQLKFLNKLLLFLLLGLSAKAQPMDEHRQAMQQSTWQKLSDVSYVWAEHPEFGRWKKPVFSSAIKKMEGKKIQVEGYLYPLEFNSQPEHVIISALPIASCYFCGQGGPETVMDVYLLRPMAYTKRRIKLQGNLYLNDSDPNQMIYVLENGKFVDYVSP